MIAKTAWLFNPHCCLDFMGFSYSKKGKKHMKDQPRGSLLINGWLNDGEIRKGRGDFLQINRAVFMDPPVSIPEAFPFWLWPNSFGTLALPQAYPKKELWSQNVTAK